MPYSLVHYPDDRLLRPCHPVVTDEDWNTVAGAVDELAALCVAAHGYALAANQVGLDLAFFVVPPGSRGLPRSAPLVVVNPAFEQPEGSIRMPESCLSMEGLRCSLRRPERGVLRYQVPMRSPECRMPVWGLFARVVQHELDHLAGRLFTDNIGPSELASTSVPAWLAAQQPSSQGLGQDVRSALGL